MQRVQEQPMPSESNFDATTFTPRQALLTTRIVWAAMLAGLLVFLIVVAVMVSQNAGPAAGGGDPIGLTVFYVALAALFVAVPVGYILRSQTYKRHWQDEIVTPSGYFIGNLMLWALLEGVAFLGLVATMLHGDFFPTILPTIAGMALMVINFPTGAPMEPDPRTPTPFAGRQARP
jgi:hypothetical protein